MEEVLVLTERLENELAGMLNDHKEIIAALKQLLAAARAQDKVEYAEFAEQLIRHAQTEEQILYPAAILAGRYIRLKLGLSER
jgi:hemerythrin superfamily protein